uniref:Uncharacterized protein n=1 Tax=Anguilla anguilla TaxID=7936 RepID=A0A0E9SLZ7_ANGAN
MTSNERNNKDKARYTSMSSLFSVVLANVSSVVAS